MKTSLYSGAIAMALAGTSTVALAQAAPAPKAQAEAGLETIVVTATKRSENLQNVPVAVTALSSNALSKAGVFETTDLNHAMPNLQVSSPYGSQQPNFSIRGIGVGTEFNANAASPVGVYVDEVYQTFRATHGQQLYDLNQVEVVRGPQGTLYGRNTTGGAVNFNTRAPSLHGTNGELILGYGTYNRFTAEGALEVTPVEDMLGIRVAGTYVKSDPYIHNIALAGQPIALFAGKPILSTSGQPGGLESYGFRGTIRWKPSPNIDLSLKGYAARASGGEEAPIGTGGSTANNTIYRPTTLLNKFLPALATHFVAGTGGTVSLLQAFQGTPGAVSFVPPQSDRQINADTVGQAVTRAEGVVFNAKITLNEHLKLISVTDYDGGVYSQLPRTDCDGSPLNLCSIGYNSSFHAFTQDIRLDYANGPLKLIVGAFYGYDIDHAANKPDFFNALSLFNAAAGNAPSYFNPAGNFSGVPASALGLAGAGYQATSLPTGITADNNFTQTRYSSAIYGEANYALAKDLKLTVGGRYTKDITKFSGLTTFYDDAGTPTMISVSNYAGGPFFLRNLYQEDGTTLAYGKSPGTYGNLEQRGSSGRFSGRAVIDWKPMEKVLVYASYSRGYRAGTFNGLAYGGAAQVYFVPPESVNAYEAGLKSRFFNNTVQLNASVFYYDYKGQQGQVVDNTATANLIALDGNEKGLELELSYAPMKTLTLTAALGLLDSKYDHANCTAVTAFGPGVHQIGNCVLSGAGPVDVGGNPFPYAAKSSINLGADWDAYKTDSDKLSVHVDAAYTGNFHYDSFGDYSNPQLTVALANPVPNASGTIVTSVPLVSGLFTRGGGDFWTANARITLTHKNISLSGWMKNVTDKTTYPYGIATENLFGNDYRVRNQPRTFGAEMKIKF